MSFTDCVWVLDGPCSGIKIGRFAYYLFEYRDLYDRNKLAEYEAALAPVDITIPSS